MEPTHQMTTLTAVMETLRQKGFDAEWRWVKEGFTAGKEKIYQPNELEIIKVYRFEGASDPGDSSILYLIEANDGLIGYSLGSYGVYSDHDNEVGYDNFIRLIPERGHSQQLLFEL
jgi:hypothetical protein